MTTTIRDGYDPEPDYTGITADGTQVRMHVRYKKVASIAAVGVLPRDEFLRAVETELNVKIIDRETLPTPVPHPTNPDLAYVRTLTASRGRTAQPSDVLMARALDYIAAAQWAASEPPMDEAKVQRLAKAVQAADEDERLDSDDLDRLARRLVRAGVRPPKDA